MNGVALLKIRALVEVKEGMRVYYDCPTMSQESFEANKFFGENRGKTGFVKGFSEEFVGPLDSKGRLPGVYINPGCIHVQFEGEETVHRNLNLNHFILLAVGQTVGSEALPEYQKVRDLPEIIEFWPGDKVFRSDDLLQTTHLVKKVLIGDAGEPSYCLDEYYKASGLTLLSRGNVYHLYNDPTKLSFTSSEDELNFWAGDGISRQVYSNRLPYFEWSLETAKEMVEKGGGDLVIASKSVVSGRDVAFKVLKLCPPFAQHRDRVRELSLGLITSNVEKDVSSDVCDSSLVGDDQC